MGAFDWLFGKQEIPGKAVAAFDHPKIYGEVESGPGVAGASQAAANWKEQVSTAFTDADSALDRVLKDSETVMQGSAGDQARESVTPLSQATRGAIEVAAQSGSAVQQQAQGSADFKNGFPPPHQVPPDNIGWTDYVNPMSYGFKTGVRAAHEEKHDQVEAQARQQYESYTKATNERVNGIQQFPPPPVFNADVSSASTTPVGKVDQPTTGYTNTTSTPSSTPSTSTSSTSDSGQSSSVPHSSTTTPPPSSAGQSSSSPVPQTPAESGSAWATPPGTGGGAPIPGTTTPTPGTGGGFVGGAVIPPGGTGSGRPTPGAGGRLGTGTGRGVTPGPGAGVRGGPGPGTGNLGGGGRAGTGTPGTGTGSSASSATGSAAGRGGPSGAAGAAGAGRGRGSGDEDKDHENKFVLENSELFEDLDLPKTAPPVFGDWANQQGLPPRPPEKE
ncbi:PPE domain-containing protein [Saccharopolyspora sp. NPDC002376]